MLPLVENTLDSISRTGDAIHVAAGEALRANASTTDLDDGSLILEHSDNGLQWAAVFDPQGSLVRIGGNGGAQSLATELRNETRNSRQYRWRLYATSAAAITGDVDVLLGSPLAPPRVLDLSYLPEYADSTAAIADGAAVGTAFADEDGAIHRVVAPA